MDALALELASPTVDGRLSQRFKLRHTFLGGFNRYTDLISTRPMMLLRQRSHARQT